MVEWGTGIAEGLADSRLEIDIRRPTPSVEEPSTDEDLDDHRTVVIRGIGGRWDAAELAGLAELRAVGRG